MSWCLHSYPDDVGERVVIQAFEFLFHGLDKVRERISRPLVDIGVGNG